MGNGERKGTERQKEREGGENDRRQIYEKCKMHFREPMG